MAIFRSNQKRKQMTNNSFETLKSPTQSVRKSDEIIPKLTEAIAISESRYRSENPFVRASVFFTCLAMVVFFMGFDFVSNANAQTEKGKSKCVYDEIEPKPKDVLLVPLQQVMGQ